MRSSQPREVSQIGMKNTTSQIHAVHANTSTTRDPTEPRPWRASGTVSAFPQNLSLECAARSLSLSLSRRMRKYFKLETREPLSETAREVVVGWSLVQRERLQLPPHQRNGKKKGSTQTSQRSFKDETPPKPSSLTRGEMKHDKVRLKIN